MDHGSSSGKRRHKPIEPPSPSSEEERQGGVGKASVFRRLGNPHRTEMVRPAVVTHQQHKSPRDVSQHRVCRHWVAKGRCDFGESCSFYHPPLPRVGSARSPQKRYSSTQPTHQHQPKILHRDDYGNTVEDASSKDASSRIRSTVIISRESSSSRKTRKVTIPEDESEAPVLANPYDNDYESALDLERRRQEIQRRLSELNDDISASENLKKRPLSRIREPRYYEDESPSGRSMSVSQRTEWGAEAEPPQDRAIAKMTVFEETRSSSGGGKQRRKTVSVKSMGVPAVSAKRQGLPSSASSKRQSTVAPLFRKPRGFDREEGELSDDPEKREARRIKRLEAQCQQLLQRPQTPPLVGVYKETVGKRPPKTPPLPEPAEPLPPPPMIKGRSVAASKDKEVKRKPPKTPPLPPLSPDVVAESEPPIFSSRRHITPPPPPRSASNKGSPRLSSASLPMAPVDVRRNRSKDRQRDRIRSSERRLAPSESSRSAARNMLPPQARHWPEAPRTPTATKSSNKLRTPQQHRQIQQQQQQLRNRQPPGGATKSRFHAVADRGVDWRSRQRILGNRKPVVDFREKYDLEYGPVGRRQFGRHQIESGRKVESVGEKLDRPGIEPSPSDRRSTRDAVASGSPRKRWRDPSTADKNASKQLQQQRRLAASRTRSQATSVALSDNKARPTLDDRQAPPLPSRISATSDKRPGEPSETESRKRKRGKSKREPLPKKRRLDDEPPKHSPSGSAIGSGSKSKSRLKLEAKDRHSSTPATSERPTRKSPLSPPRRKKRSAEPSSTVAEATADVTAKEEKVAVKAEPVENAEDNEKPSTDEMAVDDFEPISDDEAPDEGDHLAGVAERVDWSVLLTETAASKPKHANVSQQSSMDRFKPENFLPTLGLCKELLGDELTRQLERVANSGRQPDDDKPEYKILDGVVATRRSKLSNVANRLEILNDIGSYRKALSARADLRIRRRLCGLHEQVYENVQSSETSVPYNAEAFATAKLLFAKKRLLHEQPKTETAV